jgi:hypothetical protein
MHVCKRTSSEGVLQTLLQSIGRHIRERLLSPNGHLIKQICMGQDLILEEYDLT